VQLSEEIRAHYSRITSALAQESVVKTMSLKPNSKSIVSSEQHGPVSLDDHPEHANIKIARYGKHMGNCTLIDSY
jgi:hypothetical protein